MCLEQCNLGCTATGCLRTDIAQNEIVLLYFSADVDPASVTPATIRFRTPSGEQPVGEFFVNGKTVEWVPTLRISGGQTFFGFAAGETYSMTIPGGVRGSEVVTSTAGQPFTKTLSCTLQSTRGIVDLNGVPPLGTLIQPTAAQINSAPLDTQIMLEFNELIDATPFVSGTISPIAVAVRRTRDASVGGKECDPASAPQIVAGTQTLTFDAARGVSIWTFRPAQQLPGNVCVEVSVTDGVVDLSGRPAQPRTYSFLTMLVPVVETSITENFDDNDFLDGDASAAQWTGGSAVFARIGGDGRHGTFDPEAYADPLGLIEGKRTFRLNTDNTIIPASYTTTGSPIAITNGEFYFDKMVLPADMRLRFTGTHAPVITVSGRLDLQGEIDVAGTSQTTLPLASQTSGQPGAAAGIFGGAGGQGGDRCSGSGASPVNNGRPGGAAQVHGAHAYFTSAAATAGRGSTVFPANGVTGSILYGPVSAGIAYSPQAAAGGGGGGLRDAGGTGHVVTNNHPNWLGGTPPVPGGLPVLVPPGLPATWPAGPWVTAMGPTAPGGAAMQLFPFPIASPTSPAQGRSSLHFLVGGAGGGGGASHACLSINLVPGSAWSPGCGGGGGGGAIALRAGDSLRIGPTGRVLAFGGGAASNVGGSGGAQPAPGGGGSGGSVVLQAGRLSELAGLIDVRGGAGGIFNRNVGTPPSGAMVQIAGGDGSPGFVRFEAPAQPPLSALAGMLPAPVANNVGQLDEVDDLVMCRSKFYSTGLLFGPEYARYEIHAIVGGVPVVFSDDPNVSTMPAQPGASVRALFQSARLDLATSEPLETGPWRTAVRTTPTETGIASDGFNGFRFQLLIDRSLGQTVTIDKVVIVYRV
ncbi:MAG TPA: Ig-like domain-containing protein [Planctomycetota bacterium]|nr:Ig-like domain-containing protein [Planctomycetota bacterium]